MTTLIFRDASEFPMMKEQFAPIERESDHDRDGLFSNA